MITKRLTTACVLFALVELAVTDFGCAAFRSSPGTMVPISSFDQVAGQWEGMSKRIPTMRKHASVWLSIGNNGAFTVVSDRGTAILLGAGIFTRLEGQLLG